MTKHHDKADNQELLATLETFLSACRSPAVLEPGEGPIALESGKYSLEVRADRLWLEIWTEERSISRRILCIEGAKPGAIDCTVHRFANKPGLITFLDLDRPQSAHKTLASKRQILAEQFRRMLYRQFPGWQIDSLSSAMDLQRSFSPVFPRARLSRGLQQVAAVLCPDCDSEPSFLTFALIWFDHVRAHTKPKMALPKLCVFLPESAGCLTAQRLRWLDHDVLRPSLFRFNEHGSAGEIDPADLGNLQTRVSDRFTPTEGNEDLLRLGALRDVGLAPELSGAVSIRYRGREFARWESGRLLVGLEQKQHADLARVQSFLEHLRLLPQASQSHGESWLETAVRRHLQAIDPYLLQDPLHSQVLTFASSERGLVDLLGATRNGQLAVLELKASEDIHLPLQGLDYWMRVQWHLQHEEIAHLFPGIRLASVAPKLFFVAPALSFHSANSTVLRYFSSAIHVERIGINSDWRHDFRVIMRLRGAEMPQSHTSNHGHPVTPTHQVRNIPPQS